MHNRSYKTEVKAYQPNARKGQGQRPVENSSISNCCTIVCISPKQPLYAYSVLFVFLDSICLHFMTIQSSNLVSTVADNAFQLLQPYLLQEAITTERTDDNSSPYALFMVSDQKLLSHTAQYPVSDKSQ